MGDDHITKASAGLELEAAIPYSGRMVGREYLGLADGVYDGVKVRRRGDCHRRCYERLISLIWMG